MQKDSGSADFTATHHALLFAWLARAVMQRADPAVGEAVVRLAVRRYGEQRGRRMALRAGADGQPLTMDNYLAYGEWQAAPGEMSAEIVATQPHLVKHVHGCPWHRAWAAEDLMPYGSVYCLDIDEALVRGFNPALRLDVNSTQTAGDDCCEFVYRGAGSDQPHKGRVMPWEYHAAHLFNTVGEVVVAHLGQAGREAIEEALADFAAHYGAEAAEILASYQDTDFDRQPG